MGSRPMYGLHGDSPEQMIENVKAEVAQSAVEALRKEFGHFLGADDDSWLRAARGVIDKMEIEPVFIFIGKIPVGVVWVRKEQS